MLQFMLGASWLGTICFVLGSKINGLFEMIGMLLNVVHSQV